MCHLLSRWQLLLVTYSSNRIADFGGLQGQRVWQTLARLLMYLPLGKESEGLRIALNAALRRTKAVPSYHAELWHSSGAEHCTGRE